MEIFEILIGVLIMAESVLFLRKNEFDRISSFLY